VTSAIASNPAVRAIGVALIWFVVQGAVVCAAAAGLLAMTRRASANVRYLIACAGLAAMAVMPVVTAVRVWTPTPVIATLPLVTIRSGPPVAAAPTQSASVSEWRASLTPDRVAPVVVLAWIAGVLVLTARLLGGWLQVARIRRSALVLGGPTWSETVARVARLLEIERVVPLLESTLVGVPVVIGWLRPVILVPAGALAGLAPDYVDAVLAHELAHIRRGDYLVNAMQRVVEVALFYHPAVWWVSSCVRREREHCCDDLAAPIASSRLAYARALVALEEGRGRAPALAMAATGTGLFSRIRRIVDPSSTVDSTLSKGTAMTIIASVAGLALTSMISIGHAAPAPSSSAQAPAPPTALVPAVRVIARPEPAPVAVERVPAAAQTRGAIHGTVSDQANGRIPGATITVDPIGREGASRSAQTDGTGQFALTGLPDGAYLLTVRLPGFRRDERRIDVVAGAELTENVQLRVGSKEETMTIFGSGQAGAGAEMALAFRQESTTSVAGLLDAAKQATDAGRLEEAEASVRQALAILHAAQPRAVPTPSGAVRIGGDIKEPRKIVDVPPVYPAAARAAGIQGIVILEATIDTQGYVADAHVLRGVPELDDAALDAVRQWAYTPTLLSGQPVAVVMTVTVNFSLR
jgi:TonB family protein